MNEILANAKTIRELLGNAKYAIDYYQREYRWETKHVTELLTDLTSKFRDDYEAGHERQAVAKYGHYFLGCIIISNKEGRKFLIDGQQRLTTLTLLLIHLYRTLQDVELQHSVAELILSTKHGTRSFNIDVDDRTPYMEALYRGDVTDNTDLPESNRNIIARYNDIQEQFPDDLSGDVLPYFVDWLIENVHLVEITAFSDEDAYTIFETMNDRGLSLTPTDMLKGYLLASISETPKRNAASKVWKERIQALQEIGKEEDADAIKSWLRSQYAESIRERKAGAKPLDFDLIGTVFHRWVRDHEKELSLKNTTDFARFIERDFQFYAKQYERLRSCRGASGWFGVCLLQRSTEFYDAVSRTAESIACGGLSGGYYSKAPRHRIVHRHPYYPPHLEQSGNRLLDDAVHDVQRHEGHPAKERSRIAFIAATEARGARGNVFHE